MQKGAAIAENKIKAGMLEKQIKVKGGTIYG
jgi:hypothetical protein